MEKQDPAHLLDGFGLVLQRAARPDDQLRLDSVEMGTAVSNDAVFAVLDGTRALDRDDRVGDHPRRQRNVGERLEEGVKTADCYKSWEAAGAKLFRGSYAEQAVAFRGRKVDGAFAILALPADSVTAASEGWRLTLLACPEPLLEHLARFGLGQGVIPAGTYPRAANPAESVRSATMGTTIIVAAAMADDLAYTITKTINANADRVRKLHASLADYDPSKGWLHLGVALHPGAERYYREKGWLR